MLKSFIKNLLERDSRLVSLRAIGVEEDDARKVIKNIDLMCKSCGTSPKTMYGYFFQIWCKGKPCVEEIRAMIGQCPAFAAALMGEMKTGLAGIIQAANDGDIDSIEVMDAILNVKEHINV